MKLKIIITVALLALSFDLFADRVRLRTDEGSVTIDITASRDGKIKSEEVINALKKRLNRLEDKFISLLGSMERAGVAKELRSIRIMISALPRDGVVYIDDRNTGHTDNDAEIKEMSHKDFKMLIDNIKSKTFGSDKVGVVKIAAENNYFSMAQLQELLRQTSRTDTPALLDIIRAVYPRLTDKSNKYLLLDYFRFPSDKENAKKIMDEIDGKH